MMNWLIKTALTNTTRWQQCLTIPVLTGKSSFYLLVYHISWDIKSHKNNFYPPYHLFQFFPPPPSTSWQKSQWPSGSTQHRCGIKLHGPRWARSKNSMVQKWCGDCSSQWQIWGKNCRKQENLNCKECRHCWSRRIFLWNTTIQVFCKSSSYN